MLRLQNSKRYQNSNLISESSFQMLRKNEKRETIKVKPKTLATKYTFTAVTECDRTTTVTVMFEILKAYGIPLNFANAIRVMYKVTSAVVITPERETDDSI